MTDVFVNVCAGTGKGKSTVAAIVAKALQAAGLSVQLLDDDCNFAILEKAENGAKNLIAKDVKIQVQTVQLRRNETEPDLNSIGIPLKQFG